LLYTKKNFTPRKNRAKPAVCGNHSEECVRFYNFVNLSADDKQVCLEFTRILQKKVFCYFDNYYKINTFVVGCTLTVSAYEQWQNTKKQTAHNKGFGVRRGVVSCDTSQDFGSSPPVRAFAKPRPTPSPRHVVRQQGTACRAIQVDFFSARLDNFAKCSVENLTNLGQRALKFFLKLNK